jgi:hypothetical protein
MTPVLGVTGGGGRHPGGTEASRTLGWCISTYPSRPASVPFQPLTAADRALDFQRLVAANGVSRSPSGLASHRNMWRKHSKAFGAQVDSRARHLHNRAARALHLGAAVEVVGDLEHCALGHLPIIWLKRSARTAILLDYAIDVIFWATHCTMAAINKMMVMRPEIVARTAAGLDHSPRFSCCHRRVTKIILNFCHLCSRR